MNRNDNGVERDVKKIAFGGTFVRTKDSFGDEHIFILRRPSLKDSMFIDFVYEEAVKIARESQLLSKLELFHAHKHKGVWSEKYDEEIELLHKKIDDLEDQKRYVQGNRQKRAWGVAYKAARDRLESLLRLRHELFDNSIETYADAERQAAIVFSVTYNEDGNRLWRSWRHFQNERDNILIENITVEFAKMEKLSGKRIREIARSPEWRFQWAAAKSTGDIFGRPISHLDVQQQALLYWSQVYDGVYESMDRPDEDIIENDDKLDEWFENQDRKRKVKDIEDGKSGVGGVQVSDRVRRHGEIFIVTNPAMNPDSKYRQKAPVVVNDEDVNALNDSITRKLKQSEANKLKKAKMLNEKDLRDRKNKIARKLIGSKDAVVTKNGFSGQGRGGKGASKIHPGGTI